jgi:hypothetical protein
VCWGQTTFNAEAPMSKLTPIALVLAGLLAACGGPAATQPPPSAPPPSAPAAGPAAAPATPPAAAPSAAAPLADPRAESYGGTVGSLDEIKWLVATSRSVMHAHQAGHVQVVTGVVLHRGAAGLEWLTFIARAGFKVTTDGVTAGNMQIEVSRDPSGRPHGHWIKGPDTVVKFKPVPADKLAALRSIVERTPLPIQPTKSLAIGVGVEISTTTRHMQGDFGGSLGLDMQLYDPAAKAAPTGDAPSKDLADMAARVAALLDAGHAKASPAQRSPR